MRDRISQRGRLHARRAARRHHALADRAVRDAAVARRLLLRGRQADAGHRRQQPGARHDGPRRARPARAPRRSPRPPPRTSPTRCPSSPASAPSACACPDGPRPVRLPPDQRHPDGRLQHRHEARQPEVDDEHRVHVRRRFGVVAPATAATVKNVGLIFSLDASGGGRSASSTLTASAAVRRSVAMLPASARGRADRLLAERSGRPPRHRLRRRRQRAHGDLHDEHRPDDRRRTVDPATGSPLSCCPPAVTSFVARITDSLGSYRALIPKTVECDYS